mmetsp:Transcript_31954/g.68030  ORF Transcript_31954/g.68030 Transcript_31954/m.68030 type:complete len:341 (+) Transcript_31954:136-1158(+)
MSQEHQEYIQTKVNPILENLVTQVLLERPENPVPFMVRWLASQSPQAKEYFAGAGVGEAEKLKTEVKKLQEEVRELQLKLGQKDGAAAVAHASADTSQAKEERKEIAAADKKEEKAEEKKEEEKEGDKEAGKEEAKEEKKEDKKDEKKEGEKPEEKRKLSESPSSEISGVQEALAKQKGGFDIHQGGRLRWLLFWDIAAALVAAGILVWLYADNDWKAKWRVQQGFFAIQVLYGYMAVPFFFFNFPVFKTVLTHSAITGYDDKGRVRPLESPAAKSAEDLAKEFEEIEASQKKKEGRDNTKKVDTKESNEKGLITQIKALIDDAWDGEFDNEEPEKKPKK